MIRGARSVAIAAACFLCGCADVWGFDELRQIDGGDDDATSDGSAIDATPGGMCSWSLLAHCPAPPQQPQGPCVAGSSTGNAGCDTCLTATCGATWNCCGSDPSEVSQGSTDYPACLVLSQCVLSDLARGEDYATALPACEAAGTYSSQSEAAAEALIACYMADCASTCP